MDSDMHGMSIGKGQGMVPCSTSDLQAPYPQTGPNVCFWGRAGPATSPGAGMEAALSPQALLTAQSFRPPVLSAATWHLDRTGFPPGWGLRLRSYPSSGIGLFLIPSCKRA